MEKDNDIHPEVPMDNDVKHSDAATSLRLPIVTDMDNVSVKIEVDEEFSQYQPSTGVRPFVCGLCGEMYDNLVLYLSHFNNHDLEEIYWHSCLGDDSENVFYTCQKCHLNFPSVCLLERHLQNVENTEDFIIWGKHKTAHILSKQASAELENLLKLSFGGVQVSVNDSCNDEFDEVKEEMNSDTESEQELTQTSNVSNIDEEPSEISQSKTTRSRIETDTMEIEVKQESSDSVAEKGHGSNKGKSLQKTSVKPKVSVVHVCICISTTR